MSEPKTPASQETKPVCEIDEQTQKHIDRFLEGRDVWNKWANEMLAKKEELKKAGKWKVKEGIDEQLRFRTMSDAPSTPEIQTWLDEAYVDFSNLIFQAEQGSDLRDVGEVKVEEKNTYIKSITISVDRIVFFKFLFPSDAKFSGVEFQGGALFGAAEFHGEVNFNGAEFLGGGVFSKVKFLANANFNRARFRKVAFFRAANFLKKVQFNNAEFQRTSDFSMVKFQGYSLFASVNFLRLAIFCDSVFKERTNFQYTEFKGNADFSSAKFLKGTDFGFVDFERHVSFLKTKFQQDANFEAILVKRAFSLAGAVFTTNIPNFTQANFSESPRLDNIEVLPTPNLIKSPLGWQRYFWTKNCLPYLKRLSTRYLFQYPNHIWNKFSNSRRNPNEEAHYRALKRLAIQAHDHENEMKFFAGEIRARRHVTDFANFLTHDFASSMRYWAGVAYELFSDFGRSFTRPALWWFACLWLFANLTLSGAGLEDTTKCHNSQLTPKEAAYTIGLKNSLLILGLTKTNIVKQAELCLYGLNKNGVAENKPKTYNPKIKRTYQAKSTKAEPTKTDIPFKAAVQGIAHSLLSLLFIFLLLLAIRNQFKIK